MDDDDDDGKGGGGGGGETTARRRVLTVRIPIEHHHHEEAKNTGRGRGGEKILFETMDKVFASVLETSEIRARDVKATRDAREEGERERKTYRYRAPAPRFPFVPKSIGALSETGTVRSRKLSSTILRERGLKTRAKRKECVLRIISWWKVSLE